MRDKLDRKIYKLLQRNGRRSITSLAQELGVTNKSVSRHLAYLIQENIISITVFVDPTKSESPIGVILGLEVNHDCIDDAVNILAQQESIARVSMTCGRFNIIATGYFDSLDHFSAFRLDDLPDLKGVKTLETFILLHQGLPSDQRVKPLDSKDIELIQLLKTDGQMSVANLATYMKLSRITVQQRLNNLIDNRYIRICALLLGSQTEWLWRGAVGIKVCNKEINSVINKLGVLPEIVFWAGTTGRYDVIASIEADNLERIHQIVDYEITQFGGVSACELFISHDMKLGPQWFFRHEKPVVASKSRNIGKENRSEVRKSVIPWKD